MNGYTGKILRVNLTNGKISTINTSKYEEWGGGQGMGSAIFWDLCEDKTIDGFDPKNVITIMTSPLNGTMAPSAGSRCEVQGIGVYPYPIGWFTRSNFGGRFSAMLKAAGWDGIVLEGSASSRVWINIVNDKVTLEDATDLWGMDTWETQQEIWRIVGNGARFDDFWQLESSRDAGRTTQRPAVVTIGPAGENLSRIGALVHDAGSGAGQGGFGGIFGAKQLKAISVIGTGSVEVADPKGLMAARQWFVDNHAYNPDDPLRTAGGGMSGLAMGRSSMFIEPNRISGCFSCPMPCRRRHRSGTYNDSQCVESYWYSAAGEDAKTMLKSVDLLQQLGINAYDCIGSVYYLFGLNQAGMLGPGTMIDSDPIPMDQFGNMVWSEAYLKAIAYRQGIGDDLAEGCIRAAEKWGTLDQALETGGLSFPVWGYNWHWTLPEVTWAYGTLVGDRDINEHDFLFAFGTFLEENAQKELTTERFNEIVIGKMTPYTDDPYLLDHNWKGPAAWETGIFSIHKAKKVAFHRHYARFWKQSMLFCDWVFPNWINAQAKDWVGWTPDAELKFYKAVTGKNLTWAESIEIGRRIWNLDNAIWVLQGRHRDMVKFAPFMFTVGGRGYNGAYPIYENGTWRSENLAAAEEKMVLDEQGVEDWKDHFYELEGWDNNSGWPTRNTLEALDLGFVADELDAAGKLGK